MPGDRNNQLDRNLTPEGPSPCNHVVAQQGNLVILNLIYLLFIIITPLVTFHCFIYFIIQLTALFSERLERLTTFLLLGAKYLVECVQVRVC